MKKILLCMLALMLLATAGAATLKLPAQLTAIEAMAFCGDKSLDEVTLPEGVLSIGAKAFADSSVKKINLPASLTATLVGAESLVKPVPFATSEGTTSSPAVARISYRAFSVSVP